MIQVITEPTVDIIQKSVPDMQTLARLADNAAFPDVHEWEPDAESLEILPIFAGRSCYQSFGSKAGRKTAKDYLGHIMDVGHYSVIEHSSLSFYIQGVSRTFTHELVRHRIASYSQLSQRFVPYDEYLPVVVHPNIWDKATTEQERQEIIADHMKIGQNAFEAYRDRLNKLKEAWGYETFAQKKIARETAREILPSCVETKIVVTMNLRSLYEMLSKRDAEGADGQIRKVAGIIHSHVRQAAPHIFGE